VVNADYSLEGGAYDRDQRVASGNSSSPDLYRDSSAMSKEGRRHEQVPTGEISAIALTLRHAISRLTEDRLPPPDVMGHMADRQVDRRGIERIHSYINTQWPSVRSIYCGDRFGTLYFAIEIEDGSDESRATHLPLADWIRTAFPLLEDFRFYFHGPMRDRAADLSQSIYAKASQPRTAA
jgi:hypothetical protein